VRAALFGNSPMGLAASTIRSSYVTIASSSSPTAIALAR
jgi:hypothetical protein